MMLPLDGPRALAESGVLGRERMDGTTGRSPATSRDDGAATGAESGPLLELRRGALGGVPKPPPADVHGRGRPVHAGGPAVSHPVMCPVSAGVSARGGRRAGAAARRVRA